MVLGSGGGRQWQLQHCLLKPLRRGERIAAILFTFVQKRTRLAGAKSVQQVWVFVLLFVHQSSSGGVQTVSSSGNKYI